MAHHNGLGGVEQLTAEGEWVTVEERAEIPAIFDRLVHLEGDGRRGSASTRPCLEVAPPMALRKVPRPGSATGRREPRAG
jgi:hypothetical protein